MKPKERPTAAVDDVRYFTVKQVSERYGVDVRTVRNWIRWKWLRALRKGRLIRISESALCDFDKNN